MKVKKRENKNINISSKNAIKDFRAKQIINNILYHKIFLGMCFIVNLGLFFFIILYDNQIKEIEILTNQYNNDYRKNDYFLIDQRASIDHKIVNLISINRRRNLFFSYTISNKIEFEMVKNFIIEYYKFHPIEYYANLFEKFKLYLIYQTNLQITNFLEIKDILNYHRISLFIVETAGNCKFGIFIDELIFFNDKTDFVSTENRLFIFSFQSKSMHKYIGKGPAFKINENKILELGDEEIVIYENYIKNGGYINYPMKSFENLNENDNIFTRNNGKFEIKNMEIFAFYLDENKFYPKK